MKKILSVVALFLATLHLTNAQRTKLDSLSAILKTLPEDSTRFPILQELCRPSVTKSIAGIRIYSDQMLDLARKLESPKDEARSYIITAYTYHEEGNGAESIAYLMKALKIYEDTRDSVWIAGVNNNIALLYISQNQYNEALSFIKKTIACVRNDSLLCEDYSVALRVEASIYEKLGDDSRALFEYTQSLKISEQLRDTIGMTETLSSIGMIHFRRNEFQVALTYCEKAWALIAETEIDLMQIEVLQALSQVYGATGKYDRALTCAQRSLEKSLMLGTKGEIADGYQAVSRAFFGLKNYERAYDYQSRYLALHDSLSNSEQTRVLETVRNKYELEKKEAAINTLAHHQELQFYVFIGLIISGAIIAFLIFRNHRQRTEKRLALKRQQLEFFTQTLKDKTTMLERVTEELAALQHDARDEDAQVRKINKILQTNIHTEENWEDFKQAFEDVYPNFFTAIRFKYPAITPSELRLSALLKLRLSLKESATMLGISLESVKKSRYRLKRKLEIDDGANLEEFIAEMTS